MPPLKEPIEIGEWVDPSIALPDHPFRKTLWWQIFNRATRPFLFWTTNFAVLYAILIGPLLGKYPPDAFLYALLFWAAGLYGLTTYEKLTGVT